MDKYVCTVCGYEYDPAEHDGVPFDGESYAQDLKQLT